MRRLIVSIRRMLAPVVMSEEPARGPGTRSRDAIVVPKSDAINTISTFVFIKATLELLITKQDKCACTWASSRRRCSRLNFREMNDVAHIVKFCLWYLLSGAARINVSLSMRACLVWTLVWSCACYQGQCKNIFRWHLTRRPHGDSRVTFSCYFSSAIVGWCGASAVIVYLILKLLLKWNFNLLLHIKKFVDDIRVWHITLRQLECDM